MTVEYADLSRRASSGGAFGYYDGWPTGDVVQSDGQGVETPIGSISFLSGLHNTLKVSQTLAYGASVDFLFGQLSSDPLALPLPNLFDVNLVLGASLDLELAGVEITIANIEITADTLSLSLGDESFSCSRANLDTMVDALVNAGAPAPLAEKIEAAVSTSMDAITAVQSWAFDIFTARTGADFSAMQNLVNVDLTSGMATSPDIGAMVNIGFLTHVIGTNFDDSITGTATGNLIYGGVGNDSIMGGGGSDTLNGGSGSDTLDGGAGFDLVSYAESVAPVHVNLGTGTGADGTADTDTLTRIEAVPLVP